MRPLLIIAITATMASPVFASWPNTPLKNVIRDSDLVVTGVITGITEAGHPKAEDQYQFDVAHITVQEVILNAFPDMEIEPGQALPLSMPSIKNRIGRSTDIRYGVGQQGIWILRWIDGTFWAAHPRAYQLMSSEKDVRRIIEQLGREAFDNSTGSH